MNVRPPVAQPRGTDEVPEQGRGTGAANRAPGTGPGRRAPRARERVRQAAERDKPVRVTTLLHHVDDVDHLRRADYALKREAAPGIDGKPWQHDGEVLLRIPAGA